MDVVSQATSMILALVKVRCLSSKKVLFFLLGGRARKFCYYSVLIPSQTDTFVCVLATDPAMMSSTRRY